MRRLRAAVAPHNVLQEVINFSAILTACALVAAVLTAGAGIYAAGIALGLWLAAGWMWLRGVGY